jgi:poly-gamma-glutamate synthesis protein (capsule biosynthesis protein)
MNKKRIIVSLSILVFLISIFFVKYYSSRIDSGYAAEGTKISNFNSTIKKIKKRDLNHVVNDANIGKINISIAATGDIMFHTTQLTGAYDPEKGTYDFTNTFAPIKKYIESADISLSNFETVTAGAEHGFTGYPRFNSPKVVIKTLKDTGYDILATANNHSLDMGKEGVIETIDNIKSYGLKNIGTYKEKDNEILIENVKGVKIAFLCYTYGCNGLESLLTKDELSYMVNIINEEKIKKDIEAAKSKNVDFIVAVMHWGNEYHREASTVQKELAQKMIEWGVDIILGSHPHVIQDSEIVKYNGEDKFIIYSMGNLISNQRYETVQNRYTEDGVIVILNLEKDYMKEKTTIKSVKYVPTWVHRYKVDGKYKYEILPIEEYLNNDNHNLSTAVFNRIKESYQSTMDKMDQR